MQVQIDRNGSCAAAAVTLATSGINLKYTNGYTQTKGRSIASSAIKSSGKRGHWCAIYALTPERSLTHATYVARPMLPETLMFNITNASMNHDLMGLLSPDLGNT